MPYIIMPVLLMVILYLIIIFYHKKRGWQIVWRGNRLSITLALFFTAATLSGGILYVLAPNEMSRAVTTDSYRYLYTARRLQGFVVIIIGMTLYHATFFDSSRLKFIRTNKYCYGKKASVTNPNLLWAAYKTIFLLASFAISFSGGYGFLTRTCWGFFENRYISDTFMWWAELGWCIAGIIGLFCYFKYIRYWDRKEEETV